MCRFVIDLFDKKVMRQIVLEEDIDDEDEDAFLFEDVGVPLTRVLTDRTDRSGELARMEEDGESEEESSEGEVDSEEEGDKLLFEDGEGGVTREGREGEERMNGTVVLRADGRSV